MTCVSVVPLRSGACHSTATQTRDGLDVCTIHANVYDEYVEHGSPAMAYLRITTGATYAMQRDTTGEAG